ncbi:hypothetical protein JAAARDRAFT_172668 [Jaapia argillacea MUCL 33604]|uniref:Geranylgeranyl transferase type-2 subunit alpha n=1 Tax=Jaapia argillacea MUCL 33604 TaxID=933084 RepID=A0A067QDF0_9AGAM|nr:hypothetical protein JAAARDRAFT_172668 [Jaapia argillacea MUCL 33604]
MHGVKRTRQSREAEEARKLKEQAKLKDYLLLTEDLLSRKKKKDWSKEAFDLATKLLHSNPEFYTIWNYRRNILINGIFPSSSVEEINSILSSDLSLTTSALKAHPKVYWIWNHRRWCLENVPPGPSSPTGEQTQGWRQKNWEREMYVVERMLDADARNFHAWNYRRYILSLFPTPPPPTQELKYTTHKIESNFSNFSAWHQRSKILPLIWEKEGKEREEEMRELEFDLVRNALYTDPNDQSAWLYHRWLIGPHPDPILLTREITSIQELLSEQPDSKWCMESLVHYTLLLISLTPETEREEMKSECRRLLAELAGVDPCRKNRYQEISERLGV